MTRILTISGREFRSLFLSPAGYVITMLFLLIVGVLFINRGFGQGKLATLQPVFELGTWMLLFICPAITMRALTEEIRQGTLEPLMTSPVSDVQVILGKFLASFGVLLVLLVPTLIYVVALEMYGRPDYGEISAGYLGMLLAGSAYLASGIVASTLTGHQAVAYLSTLFFWLLIGVATSTVPQYLGDPWATLVASINPQRRLNGIAHGLLDTADVIYFAAFTFLFLSLAVKSLQFRRVQHAGWLNIANIAVFSISAILVVGNVNFLSLQDDLRYRADLTSTRAYSLSEQTRQTLSNLEGEWTVALVMDKTTTDEAALDQVNEILGRFQEHSLNIEVINVDPTDPSTISEYERVITRLRTVHSQLIREYETALENGRSAFVNAQLFAQRRSAELTTILNTISKDDPTYEPLQQALATISLVASRGDETLAEMDQALQVSDVRPIPDYETARSILVALLETIAENYNQVSNVLEAWTQRIDTAQPLRQYARNNRGDFDEQARSLVLAADPLLRLPPLEISQIGARLQRGETAIVISPDRAAIVPSDQLFMRTVSGATASGPRFDMRFRGEQVFAAAIRSLMVERMPMVVFVHNNPEPLLAQRENNSDLFGVATMLMGSRFDVREWQVGITERPVPARRQPVVWIALPQLTFSLERAAADRQLVDEIRKLIETGERVFVNVMPSQLHALRRQDPWQQLGLPFGLRPDTEHVMLEHVRNAEGQVQVQVGQLLQRFELTHPIARAVSGQATYLNLPVPIELLNDPPATVDREIIANVIPIESRWLEADWLDFRAATPDEDEAFNQPIPIIIAATRIHPVDNTEQRFMMSGSALWLLSNTADATIGRGSNPLALQYPGNHQLLLASVQWLAGMDETIAESPMSRQVARLDGIDTGVMRFWSWLVLAGLPGLSLIAGGFVWGMRRH